MPNFCFLAGLLYFVIIWTLLLSSKISYEYVPPPSDLSYSHGEFAYRE